MSTTETPTPDASRRRKRLLAAVGVIFLAAGVAWIAHYLVIGRYHVETDNAYVQGNVVQITPQVAGTVLAILADDTEFVQAGQPLVQARPGRCAKWRSNRPKAQLAQTVREVRALFVNNGALPPR